MSDSTKAVFLSYASQDTGAARKIADALRSGGVEVWFDVEGGLEHGDEWDAKIRRQIKECVLFIPLISANTQAREEGYFRIEWDLAAERARGIASGVPFILPVVIDETREPDALVPDRFRSVQWTRARGGEVPGDVRQRFLKLWSHRIGVLKQQAAAVPSELPAPGSPTGPVTKPLARTRAWWLPAAAALGFAGLAATLWLRQAHAPATPSSSPPPLPARSAAISEARQLAAKGRELVDKIDAGRDDFALAEDFYRKAAGLDPTDGEIWAGYAQLCQAYGYRGFDVSNTRREQARAMVERAQRLAPDGFETRYALAGLYREQNIKRDEQERILRELHRIAPTDQRVMRFLAVVLVDSGKLDEGLGLLDESARLPAGDALALYNKARYLFVRARWDEAAEAVDASLSRRPVATAVVLKILIQLYLRGDVDGALATLETLPPDALLEDRAAITASVIRSWRHEYDKAVAVLRAVPRDYFNDFHFRGPKSWLIGQALALAGRRDAATAEWRAALQIVEKRLVDSPNSRTDLYWRAMLLKALGDNDAAEKAYRTFQQIGEVDAEMLAVFGRTSEVIPKLAEAARKKAWTGVTPASLRLDPRWAPLRGQPEFEHLIAQFPLEHAPGGKTAAAGPPDQKSVAVLAFENLSEDKENEYFSDGVSEELINVLGRVPGLSVRGRTSAFFFKGKNATAQEIGQKLNVAYLVRGSVRRAGNRVRIAAQLSRAATDEVVWSSQPLDRELKDVFAVQDEIAGLIARSLSLKLGTSSTTQSAAIDPEALEYYLRANQIMRLRDTAFTSVERVEELLNHALAIEPNFVRAQAMLAETWATPASLQSRSRGSRFDQRHAAIHQRIEAKARQAIALDPSSAEAHTALALNMWLAWDRAGAERELRAGLAQNPNFAVGRSRLAYVLMDDGQMDDAIAESKLATQLDPFSQYSIESCARVLHVAGRYTEAVAMYDRALALADSMIGREHKAYALAQCGRMEEALALAGTLTPESERFRILAVAGRRAEAEGLLAHSPYTRLYNLFVLGRTEEALAALDPDAMDSTYVHDWLFEPWFDPVRSDPRFKQFLETLGLTEVHARAQAWRAAHPAEKRPTTE